MFESKSRGALLACFGLMALATIVFVGHAGAEDVSAYQMPPKIIADMIDMPPTPFVAIGPDPNWMMLVKRPGMPSIDEVAQPELRLAGLRLNPRTNGASRGWNYNGLTFKRIDDGYERDVTGLPDNPKISNASWSPDGKLVAFTLTESDRMTLWAVKLSDGKAWQVTKTPLNAAYGSPFDWMSDSKNLIVRIIPKDRGAPPQEQLVPSGPIVQENLGQKSAARTFQDLLQNEYDEQVFEYYTTAQIARIGLNGKVKPLGKPAMIRRSDPSPDGKYILVESIKRPFSYSLTQGYFPELTEIWDQKGKLVYQVADLPLQDQIPISFGSVSTGPRRISWRADADAQLYWAEALDGGDGGVQADERDRVFTLVAPFKGEPMTLITLGQRYGGIQWGHDDLAFASSWWWATRNVKAWWIHPGSPETTPELIWDHSWEDVYNDPGDPMTRRTEQGTRVMLTADNGRTIFLSGDGASPEGERPFIDEYDVSTKESNRLFRSVSPYYESPVRMLDVEKRQLVTRRESITDPPNYFLRDLASGDMTQKTFFPDPTPQIRDVKKELIHYEREDGVGLTGTLYLPGDYDAERDGPLPVLMWAYPEEYKSADAAGQVTDSPYRFIRVGWYSPTLFTQLGYAVLDDPSMPIIGEGDIEPNDTYVEQQVSGARAAVDELVRRGVGDPERMAVGGHSYGAFMTANLLAHSDLFRLGLPRSGAYNRTLTPFGFQSEERTLWEAPDVYFRMSPFMHADKINEPVLLVHGEADNNSGTYPLQSERFYGALKGHGATVRLVMLPHESHSYRARESIMHLLWETATWLDRYVKNAPPRKNPIN
jgi:dipeptidyl aminopeptidase/acylaminoacyl peptidase